MNRIVLVLTLAVLTVVALAPGLVLALDPAFEPTSCRMRGIIPGDINTHFACGSQPGDCTFSSTGGGTDCATCCMVSLVYYITNIVFVFVIAIAVILLILAGYNFLSSSGDAAKVTTARNMVLFAAIGIAIAILAKAIPAMVFSFIT